MEQQLPRLPGHRHAAVGGVPVQKALFLQIFHQAAHLAAGNLFHQAVGRDAVQPQLAQPLAAAAPQHLDQQVFAHRVTQFLPDARRAGQHHLGLHRHVPVHGGGAAGAAVAAAFGMGLAEIVQNCPAQTARGAAVGRHGVQAAVVLGADGGAFLRGQGLVPAAVLDKIAGGGNVRRREQQDAVRRGAVPPGTAGLLVVGLQALGHVVVDDEGDVGLVDAHAESVGGHHHRPAVELEVVLIAAALGVGQAGVVAGGGQAGGAQRIADLFHIGAGGAVDDAAFAPALLQQGQQGVFLAFGAQHVKIQVGAVKAGDHLHRVVQAQQPHDVRPHLGGGRGGKSRHRRAPGQCGDKVGDGQVAGAEVLPPLGDAVGLVHRHHRDGQRGGQCPEAGAGQPLRRDVQQLVRPSAGLCHDLRHFGGVQRAVQAGGGHAGLFQRRHLVFHQRDQRRNDQRDARPQQRRQLVADGFSAAGGHDAEHVAPRQQPVHQRLLAGAEAVVPEILFECGQFVHGWPRFCYVIAFIFSYNAAAFFLSFTLLLNFRSITSMPTPSSTCIAQHTTI